MGIHYVLQIMKNDKISWPNVFTCKFFKFCLNDICILLRGRLHVINHMNYCNSEPNLGILTLKKNDKPKHLIQNKTCDQYCTECCL